MSVFCRLCFFSLRIRPFLSENENAAACQAFRPVCVCMVSCVCNCAFIIAATGLHVNTTGTEAADSVILAAATEIVLWLANWQWQ